MTNTEIVNENLVDRITELKKQQGSDILLFASPTATHSLLQQDLIDDFWLFVNPVILGQGISLYKDVKEKIKLKLIQPTKQFDCGVTELNYLVDRG